jgi:ATP-dependent DNA helicase RecG
MNQQWNSFDLAGLAESCDLECKSAQGRDGKGELPDDFWKSYSAMANADGGTILLGVQERPRGEFRALGLEDVERVRKALWDNLHNRKQVSSNLLSEQDVMPVEIDDKTVLHIQVPRASRQMKPVHLGSNPFGGTFLRRYEGDYQADDETVRRLLAERVEDSRDERVLKGFDFSDMDMDTVAAYRNRFAAVKPGHVWSDLPLPEFLERIGAFGKDRDEGTGGLRLAGLLMFGRAEVIRDALPHYMVDYQERAEAKAEKRWIDRLVPDGTWSGNVYDFFRKVYQKLTADLKVPFQLQEGQRVDDTPVHEALREALANTLIHADFSGRVSVLVVKRPDMFGFRNPGLMRVAPELAVKGGNSDCRNRRLQTMFQLVGYGDHAGSGLPKIYRNWEGQHWRRPVLHEQREPEQTLMELRMSSLVPEDVLVELQVRLGKRFRALPEQARLALITASAEGVLNHTRLREISAEHPADITKMLAGLVRDGLLRPKGTGRGMVYFLPWQSQTASMVFDSENSLALVTDVALTPEPTALRPESRVLTPELSTLTPELSALTPELGTTTQQLGVMTAEQSSKSNAVPNEPDVISDLSQISQDVLDRLRILAEPVTLRKRAGPELMQQTVLALCTGHYLGLRVLAHLLARNSSGDDLRKRILNPLVASKALQRAYLNPNDPRQAYTTSASTTETLNR